jgi:hypothetical protein
MTTSVTIELGTRPVGQSEASGPPSAERSAAQGMTRTATETTRTDHYDAASAPQTFSVADDAEVDAVVGQVSIGNGAATISIVSGNILEIFAVDNAGVLTINDDTNLLTSNSPVTLGIEEVKTVGGHEVTVLHTVKITITAA